MKSERNSLIRKIVQRIEYTERNIQREAKYRRDQYRQAKQLGVDPKALREFIHERRAGKSTAAKRRRAVSGLRRIMR